MFESDYLHRILFALRVSNLAENDVTAESGIYQPIFVGSIKATRKTD